ncbi:MAG: hypothetical protein R3D26_24135 [Cyanobacteriota/Melainabacteria group bacterium]
MEDNLDNALKVEVLAEMLNLDRQNQPEMVETPGQDAGSRPAGTHP